MNNLLENATNYAGGATRLSVNQIESDIEISIEDHGPGIPETERNTIFERFARGAEGGVEEGKEPVPDWGSLCCGTP